MTFPSPPRCICNPATIIENGVEYPFSATWGSLFGECIYTPRQQWSSFAGVASLAGFALAFAPQFLHNYRRKSTDGLSATFFAIWIVGDIATFLGAWLTEQFVTQRILGIVFLVIEALLGAQYVYYTHIYPRRISATSKSAAAPHPPKDVSSFAASLIPMAAAASLALLKRAATAEDALPQLTMLASAPLCNTEVLVGDTARTAGIVLSWISGIMFFSSRLPQIRQIYRTQSTAGISPLFIFLLFLDNLLYTVSVLLRIDEVSTTKLLESTLPFLIGSIGPMVQDGVILFQWIKYRASPAVPTPGAGDASVEATTSSNTTGKKEDESDSDDDNSDTKSDLGRRDENI
ncbi:PQ loop repeat-domain-containing protein [Blastocladiella britannica]|nr:PQ loop repeat-domain-containing protein [Blastocladiella britannica]